MKPLWQRQTERQRDRETEREGERERDREGERGRGREGGREGGRKYLLLRHADTQQSQPVAEKTNAQE